jgi:hypothetical protein
MNLSWFRVVILISKAVKQVIETSSFGSSKKKQTNCETMK